MSPPETLRMESLTRSRGSRQLSLEDGSPSPSGPCSAPSTTPLPGPPAPLQPTLPPTDRGKDAYLVLAGCAIVQAPVWGYSLAFGIFQEYYSTDAHMQASASAIASIGTSQTGIMYLMMPVSFTVLTRYPQLRRWCGPLGLVVSLVSLLVSSFASSAGELIATQGVLYAIGCGLLFSPTSLYLDEWFVERKGLAYGIMWSAKSLVGVVMPFAMSLLLANFGLRTTLQAWAVASALMTLPLLLLLKPRKTSVPTTTTSARSPPAGALSFSFMRHPLFWMLQVGNVVQAFGYLMPSTYLASYASSLGLPHLTGPILLAAFALASVPGSLIHGLLGDHLAATTVVLISSAGSAAAVFLLWGLALHVGVLAGFAVAYGFFAGGFSATWAGVLQEMRRRDEGADTGLLFGMLMGGRGLGFVLSGPVSGVLLLGPGKGIGGGGGTGISSYTSEYGPMIICTGLTAVLGAWGWLWNLRKPCRRLVARLNRLCL